ncbi:mechanosensitive ion channel [bacterium]|nr:mechanosensitive ion channel [bacterium]
MKTFEKLFRRTLTANIAWLLVLTVGLSLPQNLRGAGAPESDYVATTTNDVEISTGELLWLVKPLTLEELRVEAEAWRDLLKDAARKISAAEIDVLRRNKQISKSEEAAAASRAAKEAAEKAVALKQQAAAEGDVNAGANAVKATQEAIAQAAAAEDALQEVRKSETEDEVARTAHEVVEQVKTKDSADTNKAATAADVATAAKAAASIEVAHVDTNLVVQATNLESVAASAELKAEATAEAKSELLDTLTELRNRKAAINERFDLVLRELKLKGGKTDDYENYRKGVDEVIINVADTSAVWTSFSGWLTSENGGVKWGINAAKFVSIMVIFYVLAFLVGKVVYKATNASTTMSQLLKGFVNVAVRRIIIAVGLLVAVSAIGIPVTPLLAIITAAGLVVGLALQGTLSNFASGLLLLFYRPFDVGDAIDAGGTAGTVDSMNLMSTIIRTWDNKVMIVPNNNIWGNTITNITRTSRRRVDMVFGISYSDSMEKAQAILERIVTEHPKTLDDPAPVVRVHELGDSSVNFIVRPWALPEDYWEVYWSVTRQVKEEFDNHGVSIPFPQRDVHFYQESSGPAPSTAESSESGSRRDRSSLTAKQGALEINDA